MDETYQEKGTSGFHPAIIKCFVTGYSLPLPFIWSYHPSFSSRGFAVPAPVRIFATPSDLYRLASCVTNVTQSGVCRRIVKRNRRRGSARARTNVRTKGRGAQLCCHQPHNGRCRASSCRFRRPGARQEAKYYRGGAGELSWKCGRSRGDGTE